MRLSTSTGDFCRSVDSLAEEVRAFKDSFFSYINLQNTADYFLSDSDNEWRRRVDTWGEAAGYAGVTYVFLMLRA